MPRQDDEVRFAAVSSAPDRQPLTAPSETCGAIEIEFAAGARMRVTGAVDTVTLTAVVAALMDGHDDPVAGRRAGMARDRLYRHAQGLSVAGIAGSGELASRPAGPLFCFRGRRGNLLKVRSFLLPVSRFGAAN